MLEELEIEKPLTLPQQGGLQLRVTVAAPDDAGRRAFRVHARAEEASAWTFHATGRLASEDAEAPDFDLTAWPPAGATPIEGDGGAWTRGDEVFAEVTLPDETDSTERFGIHPALLKAATEVAGFPGQPMAWERVRLHATGAASARVRVVPNGEGRAAVYLADERGAPIMSARSVVWREIGTTWTDTQGANALFALEWTELPTGSGDAQSVEFGRVSSGSEVAVLAEGGSVPGVVVADLTLSRGDVREALASVLDVLRVWLGWSVCEGSRLVVLTADPSDPVVAAVWGLVRSAQAEHPDRFILLGADTELWPNLLSVVLGSGEPQVVLRSGALLVPRLVRATPADLADPAGPGGAGAVLDSGGTVLITGGTGALGSLLARHLVTRHKVRYLLLASRRGLDAPGASKLRDELTALGALADIVACDTGDRTDLTALLARIPADRPLTAVIHTAGVLDDGVITTLTPERFDTVLHAKTDTANLLDELTPDTAALILFSSAAGTFGNPGQGTLAAASTYLDAFAGRRHAAGRPTTSLAWGRWEHTGAASATREAAEKARMERGGESELTAAEGLELFDLALRTTDPALVPIKMDLAVLRTQAATEPVHVLLRGLVPARRAARRTAAAGPAGLTGRLAAAQPFQREQILLDVVVREVATVLGHTSPGRVDPDRAFKDVGFDSLLAVELRNRLGAHAGLRLPATVVFDHPNPRVLMRHMLDELRLGPDGPDALADREAQIRRVLSTTPLVRFQELGLMDKLLQLVADGGGEGAGPHAGQPRKQDDAPLIADMDVDDLVARAMRKARNH